MQNLIMTENVELTDGKAESILATLNGASKLEMVSLKNNPSITAIPNTLSNLVALHSLDVSMCKVSSMTFGSLLFSANVQLLDLAKNSLSDIPNNSFEKGI
jgi:Leucine-rich repeat (LRR) protein